MSKLSIRNVVKKYKRRWVLDDISFEFSQDERIGILGPNGAGKTTLFNIIMGIVKPNRGDIFIDDESIRKLPTYKRVRKGLAYLMQEHCLITDMKAKDNLIGIMQLLKYPKDEVKKMAANILEEYHLTHISETKAEKLSGGEKRRLEIAISLLTDPKFILLDEPFTGTDPKTIMELRARLRKLHGNGIGILIIDHHVREILHEVDRIIVISDGKIIFDGSAQEFKKDERVIENYLGDYLSEDQRSA